MLALNLRPFFHAMLQVAQLTLRQGHRHILNITAGLLAEHPLAELPAGLTAPTKGAGLNAVAPALAPAGASV